jgi:uncharacterized protein YkwD
VKCYRSLRMVCLAAGGLLSISTSPAMAGPVAGAKACGAFISRAPSMLGRSGGGMVARAITVKEVADLRDAVICLINVDRVSAGRQPLARNKQLDAAAIQHSGEARKVRP